MTSRAGFRAMVSLMPFFVLGLSVGQAAAESQKAPKTVRMAKAVIKGCTDEKINGTATLKEENTPEGIK